MCLLVLPKHPAADLCFVTAIDVASVRRWIVRVREVVSPEGVGILVVCSTIGKVADVVRTYREQGRVLRTAWDLEGSAGIGMAEARDGDNDGVQMLHEAELRVDIRVAGKDDALGWLVV